MLSVASSPSASRPASRSRTKLHMKSLSFSRTPTRGEKLRHSGDMTRRTARPTQRTVREDLPDGWGNAYPKHAFERGDSQDAMHLAPLGHPFPSLPVRPGGSAAPAEATARVAGWARPQSQPH